MKVKRRNDLRIHIAGEGQGRGQCTPAKNTTQNERLIPALKLPSGGPRKCSHCTKFWPRARHTTLKQTEIIASFSYKYKTKINKALHKKSMLEVGNAPSCFEVFRTTPFPYCDTSCHCHYQVCTSCYVIVSLSTSCQMSNQILSCHAHLQRGAMSQSRMCEGECNFQVLPSGISPSLAAAPSKFSNHSFSKN